jgi:hypothetical protein
LLATEEVLPQAANKADRQSNRNKALKDENVTRFLAPV